MQRPGKMVPGRVAVGKLCELKTAIELGLLDAAGPQEPRLRPPVVGQAERHVGVFLPCQLDQGATFFQTRGVQSDFKMSFPVVEPSIRAQPSLRKVHVAATNLQELSRRLIAPLQPAGNGHQARRDVRRRIHLPIIAHAEVLARTYETRLDRPGDRPDPSELRQRDLQRRS